MSHDQNKQTKPWFIGQFAMVPLAVLCNPKFHELTGEAIRVYLAIAVHSDEAGTPWVSARRIVELSGISLFNVTSRGIEPLIQAGLIQRAGFNRKTVRYRLICPTVHAGVDDKADVHADVYDTVHADVDSSVHSGVYVSDPLSSPLSNPLAAALPPGASGPSGAAAPVVLPADECDEPEGYFSDNASGTSAAEQSVSKAGTAAGMNAAVPAKAKGKAAKVSKAKAQPLTDDEKVLACGSLAMMERWLLWGAAGLREADDAKLTPTATNWRAVNPDAETAEGKVKDWNTQHFAAYFWWQVSKHREERGLPITIPDFGRICTSVVALRKTMTAWQLAQRIANVVAHFDLIRFELSWVKGLALNEGSLQDTNTTKLVTDIENSGEFVLTSRYTKLHAASEAA